MSEDCARSRTVSCTVLSLSILYSSLFFTLAATDARGAPAVTSAPRACVQDVRAIWKRIAKKKDKVDVSVFEELATLGDAAAFATLEKSVSLLKKIETLEPAYRAISRFNESRGAPEELAELARRLLARDAFKARNKDVRPIVANCLLAFGDSALPAIERIMLEHKDPRVKAGVCSALVPRLMSMGDLDALQQVLDHAAAEGPPMAYLGITATIRARYADMNHREAMLFALDSVRGDDRDALLIAKLESKKSSLAWRRLLIDLFGTRAHGMGMPGLRTGLRDKDPGIVLAVLDHILSYDGAEGLADDLRPLYRSNEAAVRRAAVRALGKLDLTYAAAREEIFKLAKSPDLALRMGAAGALVDVRTLRAVEILNDLLSDKSWSVRSEALIHVARLRDKTSIPILLDRFDIEGGRLRQDVLAALEALTGMDLGRKPENWRTWWEKEGPTFVPPSAAQLEDRLRERKKRDEGAGAAGGRTVAYSSSFYGVEVFSDRVCFVLDVSGSMRLNAGKGVTMETPHDPSKPSRMDVAKEELMRIVRAFPDGKLFNLIFFESEVRYLSEKLVKMKKAARQKSLRFISDQYSLGSTALYPALELAFADPLVDTIWLISDGAPTKGEITDIVEIRARVKRWNGARGVRIHGITIGQDSDLLRWLAEDTGGTYIRRD